MTELNMIKKRTLFEIVRCIGHNQYQYDQFFIGNMNSLVTVHYLPIDRDFFNNDNGLSTEQTCPNMIYALSDFFRIRVEYCITSYLYFHSRDICGPGKLKPRGYSVVIHTPGEL